MKGSKTLQTWLQTETIDKRSAEQDENILSRPDEIEVDNIEPNTSVGE